MQEKHRSVGDADDIIVESAGIERRFRLLHKDGLLVVEKMVARDRLARSQLLARRELVAVEPIDKEMDALVPVALREASVVCRAFVAKMHAARQKRMVREMLFARKDVLQNSRGRVAFDRAVEISREIGGREMHPAVRRVGRRRDGSRIRRPHRRCGVAICENFRRGLCGFFNDLAVRPRKAQRAQRFQRWAILRREETLMQAKGFHGAHLRETLQYGGARVRRRAFVFCGRKIAEGEPGVIMRRADQSIEIDFVINHVQRSRSAIIASIVVSKIGIRSQITLKTSA